MHKIQELSATAHEEIFKIMSEAAVEHTQNNNGIFINLSTVPDEVVRKVQTFVAFCIDNKSSLDDYDKWLNECKFNCQGFAERSESQLPPVQPPPAQPPPVQPPPAQPPPAQLPPAQLPHAEGVAVPSANAGANASSEPEPVWDFSSMDRRADNVKFMQARKKYAKRRVNDKKDGGACDAADLVPEPFPIVSSAAMC